VEDPERRAAKEDLAGDIEDLKAAVGPRRRDVRFVGVLSKPIWTSEAPFRRISRHQTVNIGDFTFPRTSVNSLPFPTSEGQRVKPTPLAERFSTLAERVGC
jgi:hypothetical protein